MKVLNTRELPLLRFDILDGYAELVHAVTTRAGGSSAGPYLSLNLGFGIGDDDDRVRENRRRVVQALGFDLEAVATPLQVHGATVEAVSQAGPARAESADESLIPRADALVTRTKGLLLMIKVADCFPLFLFDPQHQAIGLVHAGWRGAAQGIVARTIGDMARRYGSSPGRMIACIGPGIRECCFAVGEEVTAAFGHAPRSGCLEEPAADALSCRFDLQGAIYRQVRACGISERNIEAAEECTSCRSDLFFSYRRDGGKTGRMGALIGLKKQ